MTLSVERYAAGVRQKHTKWAYQDKAGTAAQGVT